MRGNATSIIRDSLRYQYVTGNGFYQILKADPKDPIQAIHVKALADSIYIGLGIGLLGRSHDLLPAKVRREMVDFFNSELLGNGWVRAMSLSDQVRIGPNPHPHPNPDPNPEPNPDPNPNPNRSGTKSTDSGSRPSLHPPLRALGRS